ncbi:N-acetylmuramic acid 6-phosphate etherase [uncultured Clostridium sp.]|uniref:N-acetylmuramic acid 6-phosphate etherase n=1 Tax=uncultured Clostridium sp. TaxID=59620 RepID=UPI000821082C|nr:N-acetylmuramic acid 6-phosphate etherase [uncultured Clostridium sp.]SCI84207.1 N-acetylmuramic acid 6-phosphate etherase [uncultured Clostridium sp.]
MNQVKISHLVTEKRNPKTMNLDNLNTLELLKVMNEEDRTVAESIENEIEHIEKAVVGIIEALNKNGRLFYVGSGTSGRLGVLDAVECPPTFGTTNEIVGIIAGGDSAFVKAKEGAEDSREQGAIDIESAGVTENDVVVGIAASGRTPHTIGALEKANEIGALTVCLACNKNSEVGKIAKIAIEVEVGPEVITGSTRLKAGTAQKLVLNMLSTASMVGIGKTYKNLMVDLKATNLKLIERSKRIIMEATECSYDLAEKVFEESGRNCKLAIVMIMLDCNKEEAERKLNASNGFISKAVV